MAGTITLTVDGGTALTPLSLSIEAGALTLAGQTISAGVSSSGDLVDGESATATGSGFGSTGPTAVIFDSFESGTVGNTLGTPDYGSYNGGTQAKYSSTSPHSGTRCAISEPSSGDQFVPIDFNLNGGLKVYLSFRFKVSSYGGGQLKIFQLWGTDYVGNYAPILYWTDDSGWWVIRTETEAANLTNMSTDSVSANTWTHVEILGNQSNPTNTSNGTLILKIDGDVSVNRTDLLTRTTSRQWGEMHLLDGHTNPTGSYADMYCDELFAQYNWARVELGNSATYASATMRVPQRVTSWSSTSVNYEVFKGALSSGTVYEYVIDDSNSVVQTTARTMQ